MIGSQRREKMGLQRKDQNSREKTKSRERSVIQQPNVIGQANRKDTPENLFHALEHNLLQRLPSFMS